MNAVTTLPAKTEKRSVLMEMSMRFGMEPKAFADVICATVFPKEGSNEEFLAFLVVAKEYELNPLTKEIYAFPKKGGGIQPIVSIDGWCNLINSHPQFNGIEFDDHKEGNKVTAITARIWRKDRDKPIVVTEYLDECQRGTDPWKQYPRRMLRHKALIQCARYAFGFAGIVDPDEAERIGVVSPMKDVTVRGDEGPPSPPQRTLAHKTQGTAASAEYAERDLVEGEVLDRKTGEVQWGDVETTDAPATVPELTADETQWLKDVEGALSGCGDFVTLGEEQKKVMAPMKGKVGAVAWGKAQGLVEDSFKRIQADS